VLVLAYAVLAGGGVLWSRLAPVDVSTGSNLMFALFLLPAAFMLLRSRLGWYAAIFLSASIGASALGAAVILLDAWYLPQALLFLGAFAACWSPALQRWLDDDRARVRPAPLRH